MKIFAYTENYASKTVTFITNELKHIDEQHELILCYSNRINPELYQRKKMKLIPFRYNKIINKFRWWLEQLQLHFTLKNKSFSIELNNVLSEFKPDLIHCHFGTDFLKIASNLKGANKLIPVLVSFYGFDVTEKFMNKAILKKYRTLLNNQKVYSIAVADSLTHKVNSLAFPKNKTITLHSGIDTNFYKRTGDNRSKNDFLFLQVSSFYPKKGHHLMLEAFKEFLNQDNRYNYKMILAGFGPLEESIALQIKKLGLEKQVSMQSAVSPSEMIEICCRVNAFVHMSETADNGDQEGLPNVLLEVMALELPILSTLHAGIPNMIVQGVNGILCEEKNKSEYIKGFKEIVNWPLCPHNRQRVIEHFSFSTHIQKLENLYQSIINSRASIINA
ncbi:MAG: glycosyltransferase family 4 protein [Sphingobacteriaceae bacterium]|nr:glycosyltransferase family 4 protein [Sphingobacteriaceae bacterium]